MDPRDFYQQAEELAHGKPGADYGKRAVDCRTAISRVYYASYNVAVLFLTSMNIPITRRADSHTDVQRYLKNSGDPELIGISADLNQLRTSRNHADYDLDRTDVETRESVCFHVSKARAVIQVIDSCTSQSRRSRIAASILTYRKDVLRLP